MVLYLVTLHKYVDNFMVGIIKHRPDKVIHPRIQSCKNGGCGLFDHIDPGYEISGFTYQKFSRFKDE